MSHTDTREATTLSWCDCQHYTTETIYPNHHGRCETCYQNCPAVGGHKEEGR